MDLLLNACGVADSVGIQTRTRRDCLRVTGSQASPAVPKRRSLGAQEKCFIPCQFFSLRY